MKSYDEMTNDERTNELWQIAQRVNGDYRSDYSGRGMYGSKCVAIVIEGRDQEYRMTKELEELGFPEPTWDSMGFGAVAYWPSISD